jgi:hypothetical protein
LTDAARAFVFSVVDRIAVRTKITKGCGGGFQAAVA